MFVHVVIMLALGILGCIFTMYEAVSNKQHRQFFIALISFIAYSLAIVFMFIM